MGVTSDLLSCDPNKRRPWHAPVVSACPVSTDLMLDVKIMQFLSHIFQLVLIYTAPTYSVALHVEGNAQKFLHVIYRKYIELENV